MIVREYLNCATCQHPHIARIQVGHGGRQEHSFLCFNCKEPIKIAMDIDNKNIEIDFHLISNCIAGNEEEGTPVFLSSNFVVDEKKINEEFYFGSFDFFKSIMSSTSGKKHLLKSQGAPGKSISEAWEKIKKIWRLEDAKQYNIANALNKSFGVEYNVTVPILRNNLRFFVDSTFSREERIFVEMRKAETLNPKEFSKFLLYYQLHLREQHRRSAYEILSDYFDNYMAFSQIFAYVRSDLAMPNSAKATSLNFNEIKSFYAKAYEFYSGSICIFTCLNNIIEGRNFDQLRRMSLKEYVLTDKAKRRMSFMDNNAFSDASVEFDSKIRNASFHNWFFMLANNVTLELRSGGTGAVETITYTKYMHQCVLIFSQICKLLSLELALDQIACDQALVTRQSVIGA